MVIAKYTINNPLKCSEAVKRYTSIGIFFSINKYMLNSNLTFPTNELKKNKKMQSTLI